MCDVQSTYTLIHSHEIWNCDSDLISKYLFLQGGALTLYTAIHSKYKIGAFIPTVAWLPLLNQEPPSTWGTPANKDTPIFHMNGNFDIIVPKSAGKATKIAMKQVFTNYQLENMLGGHFTTTTNRLNMPKLYSWLKENIPGIALDWVLLDSHTASLEND